MAAAEGGSARGRGPRRSLGQNFMVDRELLAQIVALANPAPSECGLEVGGGAGALTRLLAPRFGFLHVVELDRGLEEQLAEAVAPYDNVSLHWGDALRVDYAALQPLPTVLVANLPYRIAATLLLRLALHYPPLERFVVMVQWEVGARLCATPGGPNPRAYGAPAALLQRTFKVSIARRVGPTAFWPQPRISSSLLVGERYAPPPAPQLVALVRAAFAHRRKPLAHSLSLSHPNRPSRAQVERALARLGFAPTVRAEELGPDHLAALALELQ